MIRNLTIIFWLASSIAAAQAPGEDPHAGDPSVEVEVEADTPAQGDYDPRTMRTSDFDEIARARFIVGQRLYEAGRFADAATEFERAFEISGRSSLLFNAYLAHRDAGNLADSVRTLEAYLRETPDAADHVQLTNRLSAMRASLATERRVQAEANAAAQAERQRLVAEREEQRRQAEALQAQVDRDARGLSTVGLVVGGVGVAMLVSGGAMALVARNRTRDIEAVCPSNRCPLLFPLDDELDSARRAQHATDALVFGGLAVTVTGVVLAFVLRKSTRSTQAGASCTGTGCGLEVTGRF